MCEILDLRVKGQDPLIRVGPGFYFPITLETGSERIGEAGQEGSVHEISEGTNSQRSGPCLTLK